MSRSAKSGTSLSRENNTFKGGIGSILAKKGDHEIALSTYRQILGAEPSNSASYVDIGRVLTMMGRYDEAIQSFYRALELDPDYIPAFPMLMTAYLEKNEIAHAREFYYKYIGKGFTVGPDIEERLGVLTDAPASDR